MTAGGSGFKLAFTNSSESFLQICWGKRIPVYSGVFAERSNVVTVPWIRQNEWLKNSSNEMVNTCQKPAIFYRDYYASMDKLGLVFDFFAGTGTASSVALERGINFFAIEKDETQFRFLKHRLQKQAECQITEVKDVPKNLPEIIWEKQPGILPFILLELTL